jgi:hypothetical protein
VLLIVVKHLEFYLIHKQNDLPNLEERKRDREVKRKNRGKPKNEVTRSIKTSEKGRWGKGEEKEREEKDKKKKDKKFGE